MTEPSGQSPVFGRTIRFALPLRVKLLNETQRMHWRARQRYNRLLAWEVRIATLGQVPPAPIPRAVVTIARSSNKQPDHDGLVGGMKGLIDALLPASRTHPAGVGLLLDDSPACMELIALHVQAAPGLLLTTVTIRELL